MQQAYDGPFEVEALDLESLPSGRVTRLWLKIISDTFGEPIRIPVLVGKGREKGKTIGITAAVHGNELNGISVIQKLFQELEEETIKGTIIGIPVVNVPALIRKKRRFNDGTDLNHIMPGKENGNISQIYAHRFFERVVKHFDYLVDLHTASVGRVNSYYIRADMEEPTSRDLAMLQNADIIVHNPPSDGTLRGAADEIGIPAITLEVGNPSTFQKGMIRSGLTGLHNALVYLKMKEGEIEAPDQKTVLCKRSYWIYTDRGGLLTVIPKERDLVKKGDLIALQRNVFGDVIREYLAPENGIVIGKSISPINQTGGRILHLGIV